MMLTKLLAVSCRIGVSATLLALGSFPASVATAAPNPTPTGKVSPQVAKKKPSVGSGKPVAKTDAKAKAKKKSKVAVRPPPLLPPVEPVRSEAASRMVAWIASAHDNGALPYIVIDKQAASLSLFAANGDFLGETPVLLGIGVGDDSTPGVGAKQLSEIGPAERTTPAGRFVSKFGKAFGKQRVLWVDYANSVALHAVITDHKSEKRVERLLTPTPDDNRISFGCINVGTRFYAQRIRPQFLKKGGVVYILPDTRPLDEVFPRVRLLPYLAGTSAVAS